MEYRGNPSLPAEIQQRIRSTFDQALQSAKAGNLREALLGCDFILKLDAEFAPARTLAERVRNALAGSGQSAPAAPPPAAPSGPSVDQLAVQVKELFAARRFDEVVALAGTHQEKVMAAPELRQLVTRAQERQGIEPFLVKFLGGAQKALLDGDLGEAEKLLKQARELDPGDPRLAQVERMLEAQRPAAAPPPLPPTFEVPAASEDPLAGLADEVEAGWSAFDAEDAPAATDTGPLGDPLGDLSFDLGEPVSAAPADIGSGFAFGASPEPSQAPDPFADDASFDALFDESFGSDTAAPMASGLDAGSGSTHPPSSGLDELDDDLDFSIGEFADEPATPPPSRAATPAAAGGDRIQQLLDEGQAAFDQEDFQGAIDAWSRIFLIDIDHQEASRRIEKARSLKAEVERKVEEVFHDALGELEEGRLEAAKEKFQRVLELHPGHTVALEYLQRIERGAPGASAVQELPSMTPPQGLDLEAALPEELPLHEEIMVPPDPGAVPPPPVAPAAPRAKKKGGADARRRFALISALSLVLVLVLGWFLFTNWDRFFPNTDTATPATPPPESASPIDQARKLHEKGKDKMALSQLRRIPDNSPFHDQAQKLIAEIEAGSAAPAVETETPAATAPEVVGDLAERRDGMIADARRAFAAGQALKARDLLREAADIRPLASAETDLQAEVDQRLEPLKIEIQLFEDGEWAEALPALWRLHEADPADRDVNRLLVDSYYNLGVRYLQRSQPVEAAQSFDEVLGLEPDDAEAQRHDRFAKAYAQEPSDLRYRIYVKYLPYR
ncbi:MAG: hypothetical protein KDD11_01290 [Acidobacteria bacterium]|nr:hypothetical protein [Acidobacteriota bacterium]